MQKMIEEKYDTIKFVEKRLEFLFGSRLRHKEKIVGAVKKLDELKKKLTANLGSFDGVAEIRKWRDSRCM